MTIKTNHKTSMKKQSKNYQTVLAMRAKFAAFGILRYEVYAHDDDKPAIKRFADKLRKKRMKEI